MAAQPCNSRFKDENGSIYRCFLAEGHESAHDSHPAVPRMGCTWTDAAALKEEPRVEAGDRALETARISNFLESEDFYEVMQTYRHMPVGQQAKVAEAFEAVKKMIQSAMSAQERELREALQKIADNYGGCHCHHDTPDCCENPAVGEFCPHCIAEIALANSGVERLLAERGEGR